MRRGDTESKMNKDPTCSSETAQEAVVISQTGAAGKKCGGECSVRVWLGGVTCQGAGVLEGDKQTNSLPPYKYIAAVILQQD